MDENNTFIDLLRPSLPGAWIAEHLRIWQMNFLNASELASFGKSRGLASYSTKDIIQFWQLGLLKADLLRSCRKLSQIGLIYRGTDRYGRHIYSDERQLPRRLRSWKNAQKNLKPLREGIDLLFHPFRYYVLYHINKELDLHISKMQMLYQDGFTRVLDWSLSSFNRWMSSEQFTSNIRDCPKKDNEPMTKRKESQPRSARTERNRPRCVRQSAENLIHPISQMRNGR